MTTQERTVFPLTLTNDEATALRQLLRIIYYSSLRELASHFKEEAAMRAALDALRHSLEKPARRDSARTIN